jgi:hypothetical protein
MTRRAFARVLAGIISVAVAFVMGCEDLGVKVPPDLPVETLLAIPETLIVQNRTLTLSTNLWRDLMPSTDGDHSHLIALVYVETTESTQLPGGVTADAVWIVSGKEVWKSFFSDEPRPPDERKPYRLSAIARGGPRWDGYVDVIVRVFDGQGKAYLLRAAQQSIARVY